MHIITIIYFYFVGVGVGVEVDVGVGVEVDVGVDVEVIGNVPDEGGAFGPPKTPHLNTVFEGILHVWLLFTPP